MKALKVIGKIFLFIISGILVLLLLVSIFIDPFVRNYLEDQINDADQGQYSAQIEEVNVSIIRGNFSIHGLDLVTDTLVARENETPVVNLQAGEISIDGVSWLNFLLTDRLQLDRVSLLDINLEAKVRTVDEDEDDEEESAPFKWENLDIYPQIKEYVDRVRLNDLRFRNLDLTMINIGTEDTLHFNAGEFNVLSDDILIDADRVFTDNRAFYASRIDIQGKEVVIDRTGEDPWLVQFGIIEFDTRESEFGIFSENAMVFMKGATNKDTIAFASVQEFSLDDLDMNRVQEDSVARIRSITLNNMRVINNMDVEEEDVEQADKQDAGFDIADFTLGDNLPELLDRVIIREINLKNISYQQLNEVDVKRVDIVVNNMKIDNRPAFADNRFLHSEKFVINVRDVGYTGGEPAHHINLGNFEINMEEGTGHVAMDHLSANTAERVEGEMYTRADIPGFKVLGIDTRQLPDRVLSIDSIAIEYPDLALNMGGAGNGAEEEADTGAPAAMDLYPAIEDMLNEVRINKIAFISGNIQVSGMEDNPNGVHLPAVYAQVSDLLIAEGTAFAGRRIMHADDIAVRLENIHYQMPDNVYSVNLDLFRMSTREKFIKTHGLKYAYNNNYRKILRGPEDNQVMSVTNKSFSINNLEFQDLIKQNGFFASSINAEGTKVYMYVDNNYPAEEEEEEELGYPMPQQMIRDIEMPVYLGELVVKNVDVTLEEMAEGGEEPGIFTMNDINLSVENFSNVNRILQSNPDIHLGLSGLLMGDGRLQTEVTIPMLGENRNVHIRGGIDSLDLTKLNRYTEYTTRFGIESGVLYKVLWDFEADSNLAVGEFGLSYEALNVQLSEEESPDPAGTLYQIGAYVANALVLDTDIAEEKHEEPKTASFEREKDEDESFIEHYIASLMAGFVEVMGFPLSIINP